MGKKRLVYTTRGKRLNINGAICVLFDEHENIICTIPTHAVYREPYAEVGYAYKTDRSCMRKQGTHRTPTVAVCVGSCMRIVQFY